VPVESREHHRVGKRLPLPVRGRFRSIDSALLPVLATVLLSVLGAIFVSGFLTAGNLKVLFQDAAPVTVIAVGSAVVILTKNIDLSLAAIVPVSAEMVIRLETGSGFGEGTAVLTVFLIALGVALLNGAIVAYVGISSLFATLATWQLISGLFGVLFLGADQYVVPKNSRFISDLGTGDVLGVSVPIAVAALVVIVVWLGLKYTAFGRLFVITGDNPQAARLNGIPVRRVVFAAFCVSALLGALSALMSLGQAGVYSSSAGDGGINTLFIAITAVVLGGVSLSGGQGSIFGVLGGVAFISVLESIMTLLNFSEITAGLVQGIVLLAALAIDRQLHPRDEETARLDEL
jgi:ribose transport system permease protein